MVVHIAPNMLITGREMRKIREGVILQLISVSKRLLRLFLKTIKRVTVRRNIFKAVNKGVKESGLKFPNKGPSSLTERPINIRMATLSPTEKTRTSIWSSSLGRINRMISSPGITVKYVKLIICLATGISKSIEAFTMSWKNTKIKKTSILVLFSIFY